MLWCLLCVAINTGNDLPRREDFDALMSSSVIEAPPSDSGTGPDIPAPRTTELTLLLTKGKKVKRAVPLRSVGSFPCQGRRARRWMDH